MSTSINMPDKVKIKIHKTRAPWRERLVQAERGIGTGARQDSIVFVHLFMTTVILLTGMVLQIVLWQWMLIILSLVVLFVSELFNQALKALAKGIGNATPAAVSQALCISTGASMLSLAGVLLLSALVFAQRAGEMFGK